MNERLYNLHLFGQTTLTMGIPGYGTVSGIRSETNPLVAGGTEDAIGFEL
jgi:hypothetical protein